MIHPFDRSANSRFPCVLQEGRRQMTLFFGRPNHSWTKQFLKSWTDENILEQMKLFLDETFVG